MDSELLKTVLPVVGGALALLGGVFTFVSGRLRDAPSEDAKARVLGGTWVWAAIILWLVGIGIGTFSQLRMLAIPFYFAAFAIQWRLFVDGPEPASRRAVATFAASCAVVAFAVLFSVFTQLIDQLVELQGTQVELLKNIVEPMKKKPQ
jgi:hypothetical protein